MCTMCRDEFFRIRSFHQSAFDVARVHLHRVCCAVGPRNAGEYFLGCLSVLLLSAHSICTFDVCCHKNSHPNLPRVLPSFHPPHARRPLPRPPSPPSSLHHVGHVTVVTTRDHRHPGIISSLRTHPRFSTGLSAFTCSCLRRNQLTTMIRS